jgi:RND superfamily putative drug exporter
MQVRESSQEQVLLPGALAGEQPLQRYALYRIGLAYGRLVYRLRWLILLLWVIGVGVSVPFAGRVTSVLSGGGYSHGGSESVRVQNILIDKLRQPPAQLLVVFQSTATPVSDPAYQREVNDFIGRAKQVPHVSSVVQGGAGNDNLTTYVMVNLDHNAQYAEQQLPTFRTLLPSDTASSPARVYLTGSPAVAAEFTAIAQRDTERAELAALPIALAVLLIVFGTAVAALMPLLLAVVAVPVALAVIYAIALHNATSVFVVNIATIVGLGIAIDYSLFMTRRFRSELALGRSVVEAVAWTVTTAGKAILFSGLTVMIGFSALFLVGIQFMASFGIGGAVVVAAAVLASLTLLPALLSVLGRRINALRIPLLSRRSAGAAADSARVGVWHRWALAVMRRPVLIILVVSALLLGLGWPIVWINLGTPTTSSLPAGAEPRRGLDILAQQFPAMSGNPILIVAQTPDGASILTAENVARVSALTQWLGAQRHITLVTSLTSFPTQPGTPAPTEQELESLYSSGAYTRDPALARLVASTTSGDTTLITAQTDTALDSDAGKALIDHVRANRAEGQGLVVRVGGPQATTLDFTRYLYNHFPAAILFIVLATYVLLLMMFRSVLLPLKAILMNVLSVSAAYGVLVFVFQWGNFAGLLGFQSTGVIDSFIPILMFCILFGLSMDYEVFLLSSIQEEWLRTHDNRLSVARGLERTGGVITSAALLFVIVTGAFTFTTLAITKEMGLGMVVAVLVDAAVIRTLLVPATMRLLGRWN